MRTTIFLNFCFLKTENKIFYMEFNTHCCFLDIYLKNIHMIVYFLKHKYYCRGEMGSFYSIVSEHIYFLKCISCRICYFKYYVECFFK